MFIKPNFAVTALQNLIQPSNTPFGFEGNEINWNNVVDGIPVNVHILDGSKPTIPTKEQHDAEVARLVAEWEAAEYQRLRAPEYPPLQDLADALYWQSQGDNTKMDAYVAAVEAVKEKYPKV